MSSSVEKLLTLQDRDRRLSDLAKQLDDIPARKQQIESRLASHREALREAEEKLKRHGLTTKELEGEVEAVNKKIARFREQQFAVKTNEEYKALEHEIAAAQKGILALEDRELELMEVMEALQAEVRERQRELEAEEEDVRQEQAALDARLENIQQEIGGLNEERPGLLEGIDAVWLRRYERVLEHLGDYGIVPVHNGACGGCHMKLPPQIVHDARKGTDLIVCSYCGRILYLA